MWGLRFIYSLYPRSLGLKQFADVIAKVADSPQLILEPKCWSGLRLEPSAQQSGALPTK